jgi:hypothetical protein
MSDIDPSMNGSRGRIRDLGARVTSTMDTMNATSKRIEETAGWVTVTLACVTVLSIAALGLAVIALLGYRNCDKTEKSDA